MTATASDDTRRLRRGTRRCRRRRIRKRCAGSSEIMVLRDTCYITGSLFHLCSEVGHAHRFTRSVANASAAPSRAVRRRYFPARCSPEDVTPRQLAVLLAVAENEGANQTSLVEATSIDRSTLADIVRRLVRRELLKRRRTRKDTRAYAVKLTDKGREILRTVAPLGELVDQRILDVLPASGRRQFLASLQTIVDSLNRADLGSKQPRA